ncbi:MAG: type II toxin-antitoxin system VapC family toxin [Pseudomonadota bacterium]
MLDASALLALIDGEPGGARVAEVFDNAAMSSVNFAEVASKMAERAASPEALRGWLADVPIEIVPFDASLAIEAGFLRVKTREIGLSLGDRCCLALAAARGQPVLTADRVWAKLDLGVEIEVIR